MVTNSQEMQPRSKLLSCKSFIMKKIKYIKPLTLGILFLMSHVSMFDQARYDYLLYENHEKTKQLKIEEQSFVKKLDRFRFEISEQKIILKRILVRMIFLVNENTRTHISQFYDTKIISNFGGEINVLNKHSTRNNRKYELAIIEDSLQGGTSLDDMIMGAKKGVLSLRQTYNLNLTNFSRGILKIRRNDTIRSRVADSLQPDDLVSLAEISITLYNWYDSGLLFLREAIESVKAISTNTEVINLSNIKKNVTNVMSLCVELHNQLSLKKNKSTGAYWKLFPYLVNKGYLPLTKAFKWCFLRFAD